MRVTNPASSKNLIAMKLEGNNRQGMVETSEDLLYAVSQGQGDTSFATTRLYYGCTNFQST